MVISFDDCKDYKPVAPTFDVHPSHLLAAFDAVFIATKNR